ncbi:RNA polymerase sigma factor [Cohnella abietis]|uniref:RNA polymerase sigma factor n=1 Tax=Cohnella abietis TaxID=2507935 RepID=A0A3T1D3F6_9BACL|nr:RNA polymerase sigma factor [Cohnella abietis]BBI32643.1 RNA polymerase sigma factor [Cohnella abietis]
MSNGREQQRRSISEAFPIMYSQYFMQVYYSAFSVTKNDELAQDAAQETFLKAYRHFDSLEQHEQKGAWLKAVSRNVAIDMYRKQRRENRSYWAWRDACRGEVDVERTIVDQDFLRGLLSSLEPIYRQSLLLVYEYGLTYEQLANYQKSSISAVKSRVHRAKKKLRVVALQTENLVGVPERSSLR